MRIGIVNNVKTTADWLKVLVEEDGRHHVVWTAFDGEGAVEKCRTDRPDLVLMELIMPILDGVRATEKIMKESPCAILIVTVSVSSSVSLVFEAMGYGALDAVSIPSMPKEKEQGDGEKFKRKIDIIEKYLGTACRSKKQTQDTKQTSKEHAPPLLVIGASTGGPLAITKILSRLPAYPPFAVVIIQHVNELFAASLVDWMSKQTAIKITLAKEGESPVLGEVLVAGRDKHLVVSENLTLHYQDDPIDIVYRPSVDVFFQSVARFWPHRCVAALLTGMGNDGAQGLKALQEKGWYTIAQDQSSCVVFGMPKSAIEAGGVTEIASIDDIAAIIIRQIDDPSSGRRK